MGSIRSRSGNLFLDFRYRGVRCREQTLLPDAPNNRRQIQKLLERIEAEITLGTFEYGKYFPNSSRAEQFHEQGERTRQQNSRTLLFRVFAEHWFSEMEHQWRTSYQKNIRLTLDRYLLPTFGSTPLDRITKSDLLTFRGTLTKPDLKRRKSLSASRINHIMTPLRIILNEAADRYDFITPWQNIKPIKVPRTDVEPFDLEEVQLIMQRVRLDFRNYYCVRFFTGLRTAEIDGLQWRFVDFTRRQILVRQARVEGEMVYTKNDGSFRTIDMSQIVYDALVNQQQSTGDKNFVFCNRFGNPLSHNTVTKKVWYPLLRYLGLKKRRPYQTRHTAATLWLAAGESPEWIARQMGHTSTEMLFKVYSRYVPNLTRQDGSAFNQLIQEHFISDNEERQNP